MSTRALLLLVAWIGGAELFARGYLADHALAFHAGAWLFAASSVVATSRRSAWLRYSARAVAALAVLLSLAELAPRSQPAQPVPGVSFAESGGNPEALSLWWEQRERERKVLRGETEVEPGQRFSWFGGEVELDARGLRRADPPPDGAYRIVVVGGSASFGTPETPGGEPWPARLAEEIAARYRCERPVAVSNAARPGRTLQKLARDFDSEIAPLEPDLLLVYPDLDALAGLGPSQQELPRAARPARASRLLAAAEARLRDRLDARRLRDALAAEMPPPALQRSSAARRYRGLLIAARSHGVDVALVPLALAVGAGAPEPAIRFHEAVWPNTRQLVVANHNHARLVPLLGAAYRAEALDLGDGLDGAYTDGFLDLVHLSNAGSARLARHVAEALAPVLGRDDPGCEPRAGDPAS